MSAASIRRCGADRPIRRRLSMSASASPDQAAAGGIVVFAYSDVGYECLDLLIARRERVRVVFTHEDDPGETRWFRSVPDLAHRPRLQVRSDDPTPASEAARPLHPLAPHPPFPSSHRP